MYKLCVNATLLCTHLLTPGMEKDKAALEKEEKISLVKKIVSEYLPKNTDLLRKIFPSSKHHVSDDIDRTKLTEIELNAAQSCIDDGKGIICVHNAIFMIDLGEKRVEDTLCILPSKIDNSGKLMPAITAIAYSKLGGTNKQVILGGLTGKIFVANPTNPEKNQVNLFGDVPGRVDEVLCDPEEVQIAVKYGSVNDDSRKITPCLALSASYFKKRSVTDSSKKSGSYLQVESQTQKRRSWAPSELDRDWSPFVKVPCTNAVEKIWFEGSYCFTQCSVTKKIERWFIQNPEGDAKLVKVEDETVTP